jgi:hypothetical protein
MALGLKAPGLYALAVIRGKMGCEVGSGARTPVLLVAIGGDVSLSRIDKARDGRFSGALGALLGGLSFGGAVGTLGGLTGFEGLAGFKGFAGLAGLTGLSGFEGLVGLAGFAGFTAPMARLARAPVCMIAACWAAWVC